MLHGLNNMCESSPSSSFVYLFFRCSSLFPHESPLMDKGDERGWKRHDERRFNRERWHISSFSVKWEWIESFKERAECDQPRHGYSLYRHYKAWKKRLPLLYPFWMDKQNQSMPDKTNSCCICTQIHATRTLNSNSPQPTQRRLKSKTDGNTWLILTTEPIFDTGHKKESTTTWINNGSGKQKFVYKKVYIHHFHSPEKTDTFVHLLWTDRGTEKEQGTLFFRCEDV